MIKLPNTTKTTETTKALLSVAPEHLSHEAAVWWDKIVADFCVDDTPGLLLLQTALEAFDRMRQAQESIKEHGTIYKDRFKQPKASPACIVERDSRSAMLSALKALDFGEDTPPLPGARQHRRASQ
jgi:P27 family predicted phage terminase small subunit